MTERPRGETVLVIDEDLAFVLWLGKLLSEGGYKTVPGLNCQEALSLIRELNATVDAVIVDPNLTGVTEMLQSLGSADSPLRIVFTEESPDDVTQALPAHAMLNKPQSWQPISPDVWLQKIQKALADAPPLVSKPKTPH